MKKFHILFLMFSFYGFSQSAGDIIITEIMQNPTAVSDANGEWFEVYNTTGSMIDMNGWVIKDVGGESHTIGAALQVAAGGFAILGRNGDSGTNGGVAVNYDYNGFTLTNDDDEIIIETGGGTLIDQVSYDDGSSFPDPAGASMELNSGLFNHTANDTGSNWGIAISTFGDGDLGTPGSANSLSTKENQIDVFELYPNPTSKNFITISSSKHSVMNVTVYDILGKQVIESIITNNRLDVSNLNTGVYILRARQDKTMLLLLEN